MDKTVDNIIAFLVCATKRVVVLSKRSANATPAYFFFAFVACAEEIIRILFSSMEINTQLFKGDLALWNDPRHRVGRAGFKSRRRRAPFLCSIVFEDCS
jgi:hypothetical protein